MHPTPDRLEALAEGSLSEGDRAVIESHLLGCARCQSEVEEWQALFAVLAELPTFSPAAGFAERVMSQVQLHKPWYARAASAIARVLPKSTRGWALVGGILSLPGVAIFALVGWLLAQPPVNRMALLVSLQEQALALGASALRSAGSFVLTNEATLWLANGVQALISPTATQLGAGLAAFAVITIISGWVLYRNLLVQTPIRESRYVSYSF